MSDSSGGGRGRGFRRNVPTEGVEGRRNEGEDGGEERTGVGKNTGQRGGYRRGGGGSRGRGEFHPRGGRGRGRGYYHREDEHRGGERSEGRKVRNVEGDPDFWVRHGVVGEDNRTKKGGRNRGARGRYCDNKGEENSEDGRDVRRNHEPCIGLKRDEVSDGVPGEEDLRARLSEQLLRGLSECMVCLERVKQMQATWDCHNCYQVSPKMKILSFDRL